MADRPGQVGNAAGRPSVRAVVVPVAPAPPVSPALPGPAPSRRPGTGWAVAALVVGLGYAGISISWGLGNTWALDTVGGELARQGSAGNQLLIAVVWVSVVLKLVAAGLGLAVVLPAHPSRRLLVRRVTLGRALLVTAWVAAAVLTLYGGVLTLGGLLVQADVVHADATADHRALAWHSWLWDPWFLLWGLLLGAALVRHQRASSR